MWAGRDKTDTASGIYPSATNRAARSSPAPSTAPSPTYRWSPHDDHLLPHMRLATQRRLIPRRLRGTGPM